jgi:hypothetical protein
MFSFGQVSEDQATEDIILDFMAVRAIILQSFFD